MVCICMRKKCGYTVNIRHTPKPGTELEYVSGTGNLMTSSTLRTENMMHSDPKVTKPINPLLEKISALC
jgi:hypothetical protein